MRPLGGRASRGAGASLPAWAPWLARKARALGGLDAALCSLVRNGFDHERIGHEPLARLLGREVDLVTRNSLRPYARERVLAEAAEVFVAA